MTTPKPVSPAPDTVALRQQVAAVLEERIGDNSDLYETVDDVLALPWIRYAAGQRHVVTMHERNNAAPDTEALRARIAAAVLAAAKANGLPQLASQLVDDVIEPLELDLAAVAGLLADLDRAETERDKLGREVDRLTAAAHTYRENWMRVGRERDVLWDRATTAERQLERLRSGARPIPDDAAEQIAQCLSDYWITLRGRRQDADDTEHGQAHSVMGLVRRWLAAPAVDAVPDDAAERLTLAEWHAVWHVTAELGFDCTGRTDCPARLHAHGCALDPCTKPATGPENQASPKITQILDEPTTCPVPEVKQTNPSRAELSGSTPQRFPATEVQTNAGPVPAAADDEQRESAGDLLSALACAIDLLKTHVDDESCSLDHHGYCQTHGWFGEEDCHVARTRAFLIGASWVPDHNAEGLDWAEAAETLVHPGPAAPQAPAEPKKQCAWWWDTKQCPDWAAPGGKYCNGHQRDHNDLLRVVPEAAREDTAPPAWTGHTVEVTSNKDDLHDVACTSGCGWLGVCISEQGANDLADRHRADTLRPSAPTEEV